MSWVGERPSARDWTCQIKMQDGRLPEFAKIARHIKERRLGASLRGVEATAEGWLFEQEGTLLLKIGGTGEVVELAPLRRKVQWDAAAGRAQAPTGEELGAFGRLRSGSRKRDTLRVAGPVVAGAGGRYRLEVRQFSWLR